MLNASGNELKSDRNNAFFVSPISGASVNGIYRLYYDFASKEIFASNA